MFRAKFILVITLILLFTGLVSAGYRNDQNGNRIEQDVIGHTGGGSCSSGDSSEMNAAAGQSICGVSQSSQGMTLIHGLDMEVTQNAIPASQGFTLY